MTNQGVGTRLDTYIDIPLEIGLPHFISDDCGHEDENFEPNFTNFKLKLLAVICHRGNSLDRGHYISLVRGDADVPFSSIVPVQATKSQVADFTKPPQTSQPSETITTAASTPTNKDASAQPTQSTTKNAPEDPPTSSPPVPNQSPEGLSDDAKEAPWLRFDDLAKDRISYVDIHQALKNEVPYLLFYQVLPIEDELLSETNGPMSEQGDPPTYNEAVVDASTDELSRITTESAVTDGSTTNSVVDTIPSNDSLLPTSDATISTYEVSADEPSLINVENIGRPILVGRPSQSDPEIRLPSPITVEQPRADPPVDITRPKSIDISTLALASPDHVVRSSVDGNSFQSNQGSLTFTEESHKGSSSAPITPGDETETKNGFLSASRRNSISKGWLKTKSRPNSQSGENRLSATLSRLRSSMSKDKLGSTHNMALPMENGVAVFHDGSPERRGSTGLPLESGDAGAAHRKSGSFGRSKSLRHAGKRRSRTIGKSNTEVGMEEAKGKAKKDLESPDRQCVVM